MRPILATVAVLNALWVWGEFLVAFLVYGNGKPMTLPLSQQYFYGTYSNQWNLILANFVISSIPIFLYPDAEKYSKGNSCRCRKGLEIIQVRKVLCGLSALEADKKKAIKRMKWRICRWSIY